MCRNLMMDPHVDGPMPMVQATIWYDPDNDLAGVCWGDEDDDLSSSEIVTLRKQRWCTRGWSGRVIAFTTEAGHYACAEVMPPRCPTDDSRWWGIGSTSLLSFDGCPDSRCAGCGGRE